MYYLGNKKILEQEKTAFLCSQKCPASIVLKSYDWAKEQRSLGNVIVCGNHSQIEKDVFDILLKGNQPIILVLARGMKTRWEAHIMDAIVAERLLIVSPFKPKTKRVTRDTAQRRNQEIIKISDRIVTGHITEGGQLSEILMKENPHKL